ncbi:helix-turn-helix domain-containing protein [Sporomusa termitida]|uniref:helix-turn-helix domain-containing protein n=1 Tax=Sporomusa termitida TaxID=2377 RepID=UPI00118473B2
MINNNFSAILGKRLLKITKIANDTGVSRTTLTNLYYKKSTGISFDVLEKLCAYLNCDVGDLFEHEADDKTKD